MNYGFSNPTVNHYHQHQVSVYHNPPSQTNGWGASPGNGGGNSGFNSGFNWGGGATQPFGMMSPLEARAYARAQESLLQNLASIPLPRAPKAEAKPDPLVEQLMVALNGDPKGTATINGASKEALRHVALLMDSKPEIYGKPDAGSWLNEIGEDNYLDKEETSKVSQGVTEWLKLNTQATPEQSKKDFGPLSTVLQADNRGWANISNKPEQLEALRRVAVFMDSKPEIYGKPDAGSWLNEIGEDYYLNQAENKTVSQGITDYLMLGNNPAKRAKESATPLNPEYSTTMEDRRGLALQQQQRNLLQQIFFALFGWMLPQQHITPMQQHTNGRV